MDLASSTGPSPIVLVRDLDRYVSEYRNARDPKRLKDLCGPIIKELEGYIADLKQRIEDAEREIADLADQRASWQQLKVSGATAPTGPSGGDLTVSLDLSSLGDLPAQLKRLVEDNKVLSAKVKKYKQVVYDAERAAADRSRQAEALLVENAKLRDAVAECSLPAEELEQYKKAHDVVLDQTIEIQDLETEVAELTKQLERSRFAHVASDA